MNKTITKIITGIFIFCGTALHAQLPNWCHASEVNNQAMQNDPALKAAHDQLEAYTAAHLASGNFQTENKVQGIVYIVPVVFHILHQWGSENISDAQVYDAIRIMNRDFRKLNPDTNVIVSSFIGIAADIEIEFRLAHLDPNGNCTNGIDRIVTPLTYDGGDPAKLNPWPSNKYFNIWTCNVFGAAHAGAAAYAYYPGSAPAGKDGVIALYNYVGSIGASNVNNSRTLTHETGHWLNLQHTWGSTNQPGVACGNDLVNDTPITEGSNLVCNLNWINCTPGVVENVQNYMDYSYCSRMFTEGQKTRMRTAITNTPGGRNNVWTATNLAFTGTDGAQYICVPTALFNDTYTRYVCVGQNISFTDASLNIDTVGVTYSWSFVGGTSSTTTLKTATVSYATPGVYDVSLTVTSTAGSDTYTATGIVVVSSTTASLTAPVVEGFETITVPSNDWYINNAGGNGWQNTSVAAHLGSQCVRVQNYTGNTSGTVDELITPSFSLVGTTGAKAWFYYSYANRQTTSTDGLKVYGSIDCGQTWQLKLSRTSSQISTAPNTSVNFVPTSSSQWEQDSASLSSYSNQPNVRLKFQYTFDNGNNFYLDDINISGLTGIEEYNIEPTEVTLSPNPTSHNSLLEFSLLNNEQVVINVTDVLGRNVEKVLDRKMEAGEYQYQLNANWNKGIYFVHITAGIQHITKKLIVE